MDAGVFKVVERAIEIEVSDIKAGIVTRENTVKTKFGELKGDDWRVNVTRIANVIATDGDASAIGVVLVWLYFAHDFGVGDLFAAVTGDVVVVDDEEGVSTFGVWARGGGIFYNALTETDNFVGVGLVPNTLVFGIFSELIIFKCLARVKVENRNEKHRLVLARGVTRLAEGSR